MRKKEFGDFQTPSALADEVVALVAEGMGLPACVVEPCAGAGSFLEAAARRWGADCRYAGYEINPAHAAEANARLRSWHIAVREQDFFTADWGTILQGPVLVLGNPPWVTNAALGRLGSGNLPLKSNFQGLRGIEAKTGKANFDIAEWMLIRLLESLAPDGMLAMLCKIGTARKVLRHFWSTGRGSDNAALHRIDAKKHFGVAVEACLLVTTGCRHGLPRTAWSYPSLSRHGAPTEFGFVDGRLVSDVAAYREFRHLEGRLESRWRSGVKHDAARIMELVPQNGHYRNGLGQTVALESARVFPLLKCTDLAHGRTTPSRAVVLPQFRPGEDTALLRASAPRVWRYLESHGATLDARKSSIYRNRPRFSLFGIGEYSFSPWKVAVSALHKDVRFTAIPPFEGRPVVLDDTCCFIGCENEAEAERRLRFLNSEPCRRLLASLTFPDAKRPFTVDVLNRLG